GTGICGGGIVKASHETYVFQPLVTDAPIEVLLHEFFGVTFRMIPTFYLHANGLLCLYEPVNQLPGLLGRSVTACRPAQHNTADCSCRPNKLGGRFDKHRGVLGCRSLPHGTYFGHIDGPFETGT